MIIFSKANPLFLRKNCLLILVVFLAILYILSLEKWFTQNQLPLLWILNEIKSFNFRSSRPGLFYKKTFQKILWALLKKRLWNRCNLWNLKKDLSCGTPANGWFWILHSFKSYMSHSIIHFINRNSKKWNYYVLNVFNSISTLENYRQKK